MSSLSVYDKWSWEGFLYQLNILLPALFLVMSYVFSVFVVFLGVLYLSLSEGEKASVFM